MRYDFDEIIDRRNTNALNTDGFRGYIFHAGPEKQFPFRDDEFIRMWVADMEFATPPEVCRAIKDRVDRRILGYSGIFTDDYYNAFSRWCRDRYGWDFPREELVFSQGIIPALYQLAELLVEPDEKIVAVTPSYGYFLHTAEYRGVELLRSPLKADGTGYFTVDFDDLARQCADPKAKLLIWCNPHNPSGRVWTRAELERVAAIAEENQMWVISDEIHCDLLRLGRQHTPLGKVMPDYPRLITGMSGSKTFNMAGLMFSNIIIRDPALRQRFRDRDKTGGMINPLSAAAHLAAYRECGEWLEQLRAYLDENFRYVRDFLAEYLPEAVFSLPEATYLAWVNIAPCIPDVADLPDFFANEAGVLLEGGDELFVGNARGYVRLNLAMPRSLLQTGMERIRDAVRRHNGGR